MAYFTNEGHSITINNNSVINNGYTFAGETVYLDASFSLSNEPWTPIGNYVRDVSNGKFSGNFNGGGHTISDLTIDWKDTNMASLGLFGEVQGASGEEHIVMENFTLNNVQLNSTELGGNDNDCVAAFVGNANNVDFKNLTLSGNVVVKGGRNKVGGIVGNLSAGAGDVILDSITLNGNIVIWGQAQVGGIVGYIQHSTKITNSVLKGVKIYSSYGRVGGIVGLLSSGSLVIDGATFADVTIMPWNLQSDTHARYVGAVLGQYSSIVPEIRNMTGYVTVSLDPDFTAIRKATMYNRGISGDSSNGASITIENCEGLTVNWYGEEVNSLTD